MMTNDTESIPQSTDDGSLVTIDPSLSEGRSRLLLFGGLALLAAGHLVDSSLLIWSGVGTVTVAFVLNTVGKIVHYRDLPIPARDQFALSATWVLLAATVVGLLTTFAHSQYGSGEGAYFWPLAVAGFGFGLLHMAAQSTYLSPDGPMRDRGQFRGSR